MARRKSLRGRLLAWLGAFTLLISAAVFLHGYIVNEHAERLVWDSLLRTLLDQHVERARGDANYRWRDTSDLKLFTSKDDRPSPPEIVGTAAGRPRRGRDERPRVRAVRHGRGRRAAHDRARHHPVRGRGGRAVALRARLVARADPLHRPARRLGHPPLPAAAVDHGRGHRAPRPEPRRAADRGARRRQLGTAGHRRGAQRLPRAQRTIRRARAHVHRHHEPRAADADRGHRRRDRTRARPAGLPSSRAQPGRARAPHRARRRAARVAAARAGQGAGPAGEVERPRGARRADSRPSSTTTATCRTTSSCRSRRVRWRRARSSRR